LYCFNFIVGVDRGEEIKNFKPEAIETINATIELPDKSTFQVTCQTKP
jgi:DNA topoisomerase IA